MSDLRIAFCIGNEDYSVSVTPPPGQRLWNSLLGESVPPQPRTDRDELALMLEDAISQIEERFSLGVKLVPALGVSN